MARQLAESASQLQPLAEARCLLQCGADSLDSLAYWLMTLDVDFEVLAPDALRDRLKAAAKRLARSVQA
ncbi:hypothetical protein G6F59_018338 [Rhizopus arrhizus]|nr:hypothetical protein G6F59_018338 [Rhizopus arrhizus]